MIGDNIEISKELYLENLKTLSDKIFKILPLKEKNSDTLPKYLLSLKIELLGGLGLLHMLQDDVKILTIANTVQYFIDNDYDVETCRSEIFKCLNILKQIQSNYK